MFRSDLRRIALMFFATHALMGLYAWGVRSGETNMKTIQIQGSAFGSAHEAIQDTYASGRGQVISVGGRYLVVEKAEADRITALGIPFAHVSEHPMADGSFRMVTIPVNQ